jgi:hypothetical protein
MSPANTITFEVDFNDLDKSGRLMASMRFAHGAMQFPEPGEIVLSHDAEGNWCEGTVFSTDSLIVTIRLDRDTWRQDYVVISNSFENPNDVRGLHQATHGGVAVVA